MATATKKIKQEALRILEQGERKVKATYADSEARKTAMQPIEYLLRLVQADMEKK